MTKRKIIKIDEEKCNGCGECIPNCPEGALQIIDDKARLVSDLACDGLGACIGHCPQGAILIEEREAQAYDEKKVMETIVKHGENVIKAHLKHLKEHNQREYLDQARAFLKENNISVPDHEEKKKPLPCGCPGTAVKDFRSCDDTEDKTKGKDKQADVKSQLRQWPVQIMLVPPSAPYLKGADLLIAADCVPFADANFHQHLLKGRVLLVGCPKLDDAEYYKEKITQILKNNDINSLTCAHMEVPCCFGMVEIAKQALAASGKDISFSEVTISIKGEVLPHTNY
ncbi:MAG: 4Fe-4S binding protein [Candidatus Omnitrophota bacterium]